MKWIHPDAEGCVGVMVQNSIMTVKMKQDGERELTIVNQAENDDDFVNCDLDYCEDSVDDDDDSPVSDRVMADRFYIHEHDETVVLGLMGLIDIMMFDY
jgi:hypothetical protein